MKNFRTLNTVKTLFLALTFVAFATSCGGDDDGPVAQDADYSENINNIANNVIVETYSDLAGKATNLLNEANDFKTHVTASNLDNAKQAWRSARDPWEASEGFLIGPVDTAGVDPAIDSWPVNVVDMDNLLADTANHPTITEAIVDQQIDEAKGFHLIEYLLWGLDGNKQVADFTPRELEYLVAACENLKNKTDFLKNEWISTGGNFVDNFLTAGNNTMYPSQKSALEDYVSALIVIADEVANGKIEVPLNGEDGSGVDPTQEESRFSHNSKIDFANNVRSISNVYNGKYLIDGLGIADIVAEENATLDTRFQGEIVAAIQAIEGIPGTFTDAIVNNRPAVENAQTKVRKVQQTLEEDIKPLITGL